jgi:F0F1-type ATP synthase delta subunit
MIFVSSGFVVRIDDRVVDSSIKTKIETMSKALAQS